MPSPYSFSTDTATIDRPLVHRWLSEESYWARGRSRETQDAAIDASRNYSVRDAHGRQVAYARVVTDGVTFAWLCDVFVDETARGEGIGRLIVEGVIDDLQHSSTVKHIVLAASTARGLYEKFGFAESSGPSRYLIRPMDR
ncbi:GNAT family N-acetyltransferase [Microbacterium foliorum]|uniref:GNAT family N-acetyltransferase n=1 Tax=Microbacterium foliorum TaxID=104336 RepID=UPI0028D22943|nr:GNAT family N-acetyltransferase [Microbacterium foliorum]